MLKHTWKKCIKVKLDWWFAIPLPPVYSVYQYSYVQNNLKMAITYKKSISLKLFMSVMFHNEF